MSMTRDMVWALIQPGDVVKVTATDKLPGFSGIYRVQEKNDDWFLWGSTIRCDGYSMPLWAVKDIKILNADDEKVIKKIRME